MQDSVKIVECPRDAWQGLPAQIPAPQKAEYLRKLVDAGFTTIDAVSFVSAAAVPQMADSEEVLQMLDPQENVELIGIVVNEKGAQRAIATGSVQTLGFPYSVSEQFLRRNQNQSQQESMQAMRSIRATALAAHLNVVVYVSMAFGNPYGDAWSTGAVTEACTQLVDMGIAQISLADTVGLASAAQISETVESVLGTNKQTEIGVHLHTRPEQAAENIRSAYRAGCRRFDGAIGGLGGCPFAQDDLVGNIPTEVLLAELKKLGASLPLLQNLDALVRANAEIAARFGG